MALILSIETSTSVCSIALHDHGKLIAYHSLFVARSHAESLLTMIDHVLDITQHKPKDLKGIAISEGPGSYTGLRIGAATATGLSYSLNIPLIPVNTLMAMASAVQPFNIAHALCCPMIDARRMEVYCMVIDSQGNVLEEAHPKIITAHSFEIWLAKSKMLFFGDGAEKCKSMLSTHKNAVFVDHIYPSAKQIGTLAYTKYQQNKFVDVAEFTPIYLKPFQSKLEPLGNNTTVIPLQHER
jgi:tRNA threonylcarbamoyladenosine biosynthesis protein TsaB